MAHHEHHEITPPKRFEAPKQLTMACVALAIFGGLVFAVAQFAGWGEYAWRGYLIGFWFTLSLALAGPFIAATQHLSIAGWSPSLRRIWEAFGMYVPFALVLAIGGLIGGDHLYHWFHEGVVHNDPILSKKASFLNPTAMAVATILSLVVLSLVVWWMRNVSLRQDESGDYEHTNTLKMISALFLIVFVTGFSFLTWYWIMSLEPHWFSTMFQVYTFAGLFQSGLALTIIIALALKDRGYFGDFVNHRQIHDLGQLLFGFTVFYIYIAFSQFLLIWYANIPEEALWYVQRGVSPEVTTGWEVFSIILPIVKWGIPFFVLLPQENKKNKYNILRYVAYGLVFMQLYEVWYWVAPTPHHGEVATAPYVPIIETLVVLGFVGLFGAVVARALSQANLVPVKDPFLHETVEEHHHGTQPPEPGHIKIT